MLRKRLFLISVLAVLCLAVVAVSSRSQIVRAASNASFTTKAAARPADLVKNNVYLITGSTFITALNATSGATLWQFQPGGFVDPPTMVNHVVYTLVLNAGTTVLYALNATSGATLWKFQPSGYFVNVPVVHTTVYLTTDSTTSNASILYALNPATGATLWSFSSSATLGTPVVSQNVVYIGTVNATSVYAFNATNGHQIWHTAPGNASVSFGNVANGILYGSGQGPNTTFGILYAYRTSDGAFLWSSQVAAWAEAGKIVYVEAGTYANPSICALNNSTGATLWCDSGGYAVQVVNGLAYVSGATAIQVFKGSTGTLLWSNTSDLLLKATQPAAYVVDTNNFIDALKPTDGSVLWRSQTAYGASGRQGIIAMNSTLFLASADNLSVYALNATTGALKWHYSLPGSFSSFSVAQGEVFAVTLSGTIYALSASKGTLLWTH